VEIEMIMEIPVEEEVNTDKILEAETTEVAEGITEAEMAVVETTEAEIIMAVEITETTTITAISKRDIRLDRLLD
jgi:hypothetical protein